MPNKTDKEVDYLDSKNTLLICFGLSILFDVAILLLALKVDEVNMYIKAAIRIAIMLGVFRNIYLGKIWAIRLMLVFIALGFIYTLVNFSWMNLWGLSGILTFYAFFGYQIGVSQKMKRFFEVQQQRH